MANFCLACHCQFDGNPSGKPGGNHAYCPHCLKGLMKFKPKKQTAFYFKRPSDGPGSFSKEKVYDLPDPRKEILMDLKAMEDAGAHHDPDTRHFMAVKRQEALEMKPGPRADYQKEGHPIE